MNKIKKQISAITFLLLFISTGYSQTWEKVYTGYNYILKSIEFPGGQNQIGWAAGQSLTYNGTGIVIKTTNGGTSWTQLWTGTQQGLNSLSFPDMNTGYMCGQNAIFAKSTDGGVTWTPQVAGTDIYEYTDVVFKDALHGVVTAQTNTAAGVYVTSNGGATWTPGTGLAAIPYKLTYVTANTYFLVTNGGDIQKSTDGGLTWTTVATGFGLLLGIDFYNPSIGIALGEDGWIFKTNDGGVTWTPQQTAYGNPLWRDVAWKSQTEVVTCGTPETIWGSIDSGATWFDDYPASTGGPALYEILYTTNGEAYACGSQGWFYRNIPPLVAAFTANNTTICNGTDVQFTDQSVGTPTAWSWTFEGGTPAASALQNPTVTYAAAGDYNVTLVITKGTSTNTLVKTDYIHVNAPMTSAPTMPAGPTQICGLSTQQYSTTAIANATSYSWSVDPPAAGIITGTGLTATLQASNTWFGIFAVKVAGVNACGNSQVSTSLMVTLSQQPVAYSLFAGGGYCTGQTGYAVKLEDSEIGIDYQLYKDGVASGSPVPGTGNELNFGNQTVGTYTASGTIGTCSTNMLGVTMVYLIDPASQAALPAGPASTCNNSPSIFTAPLPANGYSLLWTLNPASAGTITQPTLTTASVTWNPLFAGQVAVSVQGQNECGNGPASPALNVTVNALPAPVANGIATVCKNQEMSYSTAANNGSSYVWAVTGGTLTSGQGSNQVTVLWGNPGTGTVSVTETSAANCIGISPLLAVAVNECTGISVAGAGALNVYPNPASDQLNVMLNAEFKLPADISIYNSMGQQVQHYSSVKVSDAQALKIDITNLKPGVYTLRIENENQILNRLFVKR